MGHVPLLKGAQLTTTTQYVGVPIHNGCIGVHLGWLDATSAATITLELSSWNADDAPVATAGTTALQWRDSGETITGPAASAAGSSLINIMNVQQKRARLKLVTTANSLWEIYDGLG